MRENIDARPAPTGAPQARPIWVHTRSQSGDSVSADSQLALPVNVTDDGEVRLYTITLPFLPPSKNVMDNWPPTWKHSAKGKWKKAIDREVEACMMPRNVPKIGLAATLVFSTNNRRDPQNYAQALWHWVPDALQSSGVIDGDHDGKIEIGRNWGLTMKYDARPGVPKTRRERTILAITMLVPKGHTS